MNLPESALKFLIAREIIRLQGVTITDQKLPLSARSQSLLTINSIIGSFYLSYQTIFLLNRTTRLPLRVSIASKLLIYTFIYLSGLFFQHQIILAWRRYCCLRADQIVCSLGESFRQGGLQYYDWRLRWNQFWAERQEEFKERKRLIKTNNHDETVSYDRVMKHQLENEKSAERNTTQTGHEKQQEFSCNNHERISLTDMMSKILGFTITRHLTVSYKEQTHENQANSQPKHECVDQIFTDTQLQLYFLTL
ncbi:unnamed protein product [Schistosoma curassoni]|uniref:Uncharacterized protein n=1 Tax=Schistosoma curassoni TaxID=6186 RepID=A0A183L1Q9_9TREM|nr:unnamed protein product [Schistosoma curassoni]